MSTPVIVPAQPGWHIVTQYDASEGYEVGTEAIIAWRIYPEAEGVAPEAVTPMGDIVSGCGQRGDRISQGLRDPDGRIGERDCAEWLADERARLERIERERQGAK